MIIILIVPIYRQLDLRINYSLFVYMEAIYGSQKLKTKKNISFLILFFFVQKNFKILQRKVNLSV
jgi:hypothetical protein